MQRSRIISIIDMNNFYCSCQLLFNPRLRGKPVVVLSSNDANVISRSNEAKAIGVKMGEPWFQLKKLALKHGIIAYSANFELYTDMSNRVMRILGQFSPNFEGASIDEAFLDLTGMPESADKIARHMRSTLLQALGLPSCVGIGSSKTLAKLANHVAKKNLVPGIDGVFNLNAIPQAELDKLMASISVDEVWGIGRRLAPQLQAMGIESALDLKQADPEYMRQQFSVVLEKTVRELRGTACIELEEVPPPKRSILNSRSFGAPVSTLQGLQEAISMYASRVAEKLRKQQGYATLLTVFIQTSPFRDGPKFSGSKTVKLPAPTDDTLQLVRTAMWILKQIYRPGYQYQRAGVMLDEIVPAGGQQNDLFGFRPHDDKSARLMVAMDTINGRWGRQTLRMGSQGYQAPWATRQAYLSPCYTTRWSDLLVVG